MDTIHIDEMKLNMPLRPIWTGKLAALYRTFDGIPDDCESVNLIVQFISDSDGKTYSYAAPARKRAPGVWTVYVIPAAFPHVSDGELSYDVMGYDENNNPRWLGRGALCVVDCPADASGDLPIIPRDTYVRNPITGLYHLLTAEVNEDGEISIGVDQEGVEK